MLNLPQIGKFLSAGTDGVITDRGRHLNHSAIVRPNLLGFVCSRNFTSSALTSICGMGVSEHFYRLNTLGSLRIVAV